MKQADPLCGLLVTGNVNPSEVMLCPVEQAMTQRNLLLFIFAATVPIVGIVAGAVCQPGVLDQPEDEGRLVAAVCDFPLVRDDHGIDDVFKPLLRFVGWQSINATFQASHNERRIVDQRQVRFWPASVVELQQSAQTDYLLWLAQLVQAISVPQDRDASAGPAIVFERRSHQLVLRLVQAKQTQLVFDLRLVVGLP